MIRRILCPNHKEETPSFVIYPDGHGHCYGCGYRTKATHPDMMDEKIIPDYAKLERKIQEIKSLPKKLIRGFDLPVDQDGYYLVWPDEKYYKYRLFSDDKNRYRSPGGYSKPLYVGRDCGKSSPLIIVEGEFNAASIVMVTKGVTVVSPGGASEFYSKSKLNEYLPLYLRHSKIIIVADDDDAGKTASTLLMIELRGKYGKDARVQWVSKDANDLLQEDKEVLKREVSNYLDL